MAVEKYFFSNTRRVIILVFLITLSTFVIVDVHQFGIYENLRKQNPDANPLNIVHGDEPWYLAMTSVMVKHQSLNLEEHYLDEEPDPNLPWSEQFRDPKHWRANYISPEGNYISGHAPGTSFLLIPGYALGGILGSFITISIIASTTSVFIYLFTKEFTTSKTAFLTTMIFSFATLLFIYSNRIYPEPVATLSIISICYFIFVKRNSIFYMALAGSILGFLPFLKMPYIVFDFIIIPLVFWYFFKKKIHRKQITIFYTFFIILTALTAVNNYLLYDEFFAGTAKSVIADYTSGVDSINETRQQGHHIDAIISMWVDPYHGLFILSPVTMLFVLGIQPLWAKNRTVFIVLTLISLSIIVAYVWINPRGIVGGSDPPFRYISPIIPLLSIPFSLGLERFCKSWIYRGLLSLLILIGLLFSIAFSVPDRLISLLHHEQKTIVIHWIYQGIERFFPNLGHEYYGMEIIPQHHPLDVGNVIFISILAICLIIGILIPIIKKPKNIHEISCSKDEAKKIIDTLKQENPNADTTDGIKIITNEKNWVMIRPSGIEPIIRIYAEASSQKQLDELMSEYIQKIKSIITCFSFKQIIS